jgi:hypothetical protein
VRGVDVLNPLPNVPREVRLAEAPVTLRRLGADAVGRSVGRLHAELVTSRSARVIREAAIRQLIMLLSSGLVVRGAFSIRRWCKACGGHVLTEHPNLGLTDVYAAELLPD